jgi:Transcriptional regulatory protein, C terminal
MDEIHRSLGYSADYRARELATLASWIAARDNGSVVGLVGCGRSSFLRYVCAHPSALRRHLPEGSEPVALVPVDLYDLPSDTLADLYRTILHAFYWVRERLPAPLAEVAAALYLEHRATLDPFLSQKALYELLLAFQTAGVRVVLVMNRFDRFCETSSRQQVNTLRGLRDRFKESLNFIVGMRQEAIYLPDAAILGDTYELFDNNVCYVGALTPAESRAILAQLFRGAPVAPGEEAIDAILRLSGGFPSLLKALGQWWPRDPTRPAAPDALLATLLDQGPIQHRLERLWSGLTQEERLALSELHRRELVGRKAAERQTMPESAMQRLAAKGCCVRQAGGWKINGTLLAAFVGSLTGRIRGRIWLDQSQTMAYQGQQPIEGLTPLELNILRFLIVHPRVRHTSDTIIEHTWPSGENKEVVTPNNLQVHISSIRKKIEPDSASPRYLITWHGRPGGYQFFPEGKPE